MHPILFTIFGRSIHVYGLMAALGFAAAIAHWSYWAHRQKRPAGFGSDLAVWLMLGGLFGARVAYVVANWSFFRTEPLEILRVDHGGLIYYGGMIGGVLACILFARVRKLPVWETGDFAVVALPLAHAFGRVGCFFNGCCYGCETTGPVSVFMEGARRIPVQLYESAVNLAIYVALWRYAKSARRPGTVVALYLTLYPTARFLLEFLRGDSRLEAGAGLNTAQVISLGLLAVGGVLWLLRGVKRPCPNEL